MRLTIIFAAAALPAPALAEELHLLCGGSGTAVKEDVATVQGSNTYGRGFNAKVTGTKDRDFTDEVAVELSSSEPRIRLPRTLLPLVHRGEKGWFKLKNVKISAREITASATVSFINNAKVRIDRISGAISISGRDGNFNGRCEAFDPATAPRKF